MKYQRINILRFKLRQKMNTLNREYNLIFVKFNLKFLEF